MSVALPFSRETFSILERIDVGETSVSRDAAVQVAELSVSSNGSTWVKLALHIANQRQLT